MWDRISAAEELVPLPGSTSALEDGGSLVAGGHISLGSSGRPISKTDITKLAIQRKEGIHIHTLHLHNNMLTPLAEKINT